MSQSQHPPFLPIHDDEGYYARDPKAMYSRIDEKFQAFAVHLMAMAEQIAAVDVALPPEQRQLTESLRDELRAMKGDGKLLLALIRELAAYNVTLTEQRQSTRDSYEAGWRDRYADILSQLHPADQRMLQWIIEHLDDANSLDETAF